MKLVLIPFFPFFFSSLEKGLSLLGYHLCNYSLTKNVFKTVAYQKSYEKSTSCGGWIPWMVCPRTYYKTQYHTVEVPETIILTDCCEGYEQVGLYCSLALNRSSIFASRPGICPMENMETSDYPCTFDTECPELKKCCNSSKGAGCVDPMPEGRTFWYNVTVLVKMDFNELIRVDSHFLNHSRLLHSMITGALQPLNASVHHIQSNGAEVYSGTVASQVLVGLHQPAPLAEVSSSLKDIVKRVYEVIDTEVQDVNECSYAEFNACPEKNTCVNLEGYYSCDPQNHQIFSVTSNSFEMSWHVTSTLNHTFQVQVFKGKEIVQNLKTEEMKMDVSQLEAGVMYSAEIRYETCGKTSISRQNVKTEAKVFGVTMRILNYNFTDDFHNVSSSAYEEFSRLLLEQLENSFPPNISALYKSGKLKVQTESLQAGSIIVRLRITVQDPEFPVDASTFAPMLSYLHNGSVFLVDQQNTAIEDWDECASHTENDCSAFAECINLMGSYLCRCKTTMDTNPSRPGRNCEGEQDWHVVSLSKSKPKCFDVIGGGEGSFGIRSMLDKRSLLWWLALSRHDFLLSPAKLYLMTISLPLVPAQGIIAPNVARKSSGVTWSTKFMQSLAFQFLLLQKKQPIWETKTQIRSLTVSELEAGDLYTVEIRTDVCREESKLVHQKVKAAVQKLSGTVRITNVKYSPGFSNTSSEEYQTFAQLFVDEVYKSLPLEVLQQMDAGLIKVLIMGITNGSTVVSFNLLIAEDVDIYYIITTFHDAFEHSSYFTVEKSSLSINDYDECKNKEDDCSPDASCRNTLGFYQCSCNEGFADVHPERLLSCLYPTPGNVQSPTVLASPVPLIKPAQEVSIKDAVRVFCEIEKIVLAIQKRFLQQESIPETSLYLGEPHCNVSISNGTHVMMQAGWSDCGTENMTNTVVKTILRNDVSAQGVIHHLKVASPIHSTLSDLHESGHFRTEMQLFIGNSPLPKNFSVSASDDVLIEVGIQRADSKLKVVLTDCWATPTNNSVDPLSFVFISNSCPIPNTYTTLLENGNSSKAQFKMKIFSFVNNSVVYLHCKIRICMEKPGSTCRTRCHAVRSLKTGETIAMHRTSWGPLCKSAVTIISRFFFTVLSLLIFQYQRKTGRYNFRIKSDNFGYQVFYD
uniref:Uromodulin like 1 n=1 Tax=Bubo bubo TaxID=30461 RepID=A0A8C0IBR1_BUBBB